MDALYGFLEAGRWAEAWTEFQRLRQEGPKNPRLLLMGSHAAFRLRDLAEARYLAVTAVEAWSESHPGRLLGQIRFHLAMVARELGDTTAAFQEFSLFLSELPVKYPDLADAEGKAYFYLALTLRQRDDLHEAVQAYRKAIDCFRQNGHTHLVCKGQQNLAWVLCLLKNPDEARGCLKEAGAGVETPEDEIHQTMGEAFLALIEGENGLAVALCESVMLRAEEGGLTPEQRSQTSWLAATAALAQGNGDNAFTLAGIALNSAAEARDARLINDASALRRQIVLRQATGQAGA
ncbi:MAG TPA: tetratricopeptide repeat protein [Symbiobacteriaceae bacterium]